MEMPTLHPAGAAQPAPAPLAASRGNWTLAIVAILAGIGAVSFAGMILANLPTDGTGTAGSGNNRLASLDVEATDEQGYVRSVAAITRARVIEKVQPAIRRAQLIAADPAVVKAMRDCNQTEVTALANRLVHQSTEVDVVALFDSNGRLCAFNSEDSFGRPFPAEGVAKLYSMSFDQTRVVTTCLGASTNRSALEFQQTCDFTPALNNSVGLSVAYTTPIKDPQTQTTIGAVSVRMWFERLLDVLPAPDEEVRAVFVSDAGKVFEESIDPSRGPFPIPPETVVEMVAQLDKDGRSQALFTWNELAADLTLVPDQATIADGALYVLAYANHDWVVHEARASRTTMALAGGTVSLLVLCALSVVWLLQQRRLSRQLETASAAANAASHAKSDFLAAMSHEIRTPMNGVIGMVDVLMQTSLRPNQMELAKSIRGSANALLSIVGDILDFSKIEAGKLELVSEDINPVDVIEGACALLGPSFARKQVLFEQYMDPSLPALVESDGDRLRQVVVNLLGNAVKFASALPRRGRVRLEATNIRQSEDRVWLRIRVEDNGIGMTPAVMAKLFRPFQQGVSGTTRGHGGTGLGLIISQRIVHLMGGEISVQSEPDRGATFTVTVECKLPPQPPAEDSPIAGASVLVVGRNERRVHDLVSILRSAGANTTSGTDLTPECTAQACVWEYDPDEGWTIEEIRARIHQARCRSKGIIGPVVLMTPACQRTPPFRSLDLVQLDAAMSTRKGFLLEVAAALGRFSPVPDVEAEAALHEIKLSRRPRPQSHLAHRILVAEDNETNQDVIRTQLEVLGYPNDIAPDGQAALQAWLSGDYALVLSDLHLPHMDGFGLAQAIRSEEAGRRGRRIPILALTANAVRGTGARCREAGMDDYLTKPLVLADLGQVLERWLNTTEAPGDVDLDALRAQVGDNEQLINRLLKEYCHKSTPTLVQMEQSLAMQELGPLGEAAHKLKSSSRAVGAIALGNSCESLEGLARQAVQEVTPANLAQARELMAKIRVQWHLAASQIKHRLDPEPAPATN